MEKTKTTPKIFNDEKTRLIPPWNVVLLDDNDHTYDYVIEMLQSIFRHRLIGITDRNFDFSRD